MYLSSPRRRMKDSAPHPPPAPRPAPRNIFRNAAPDGGGTAGMDIREDFLRPAVNFQLTLPQGYQTSLTEDGSKALMDLLVELCSRYHLNPALHTLELLSPEGHTVGFKPNALLGSLNVACVLIKEKVWEQKAARRPAPKVPEKTVRLLVNYHGGQKAVVRVNPLVPLQALIPVICDKCEFDPAHVLLLQDSVSRHELQLDKSLTELEIKDLYVHNQHLVLQPKMASAPTLNYSDSIRSSTTSLDRTEKKGLFSLFQFSRRKTEVTATASEVPSMDYQPSPFGHSQSVMNIPRMSPKAETKKRRAPALPRAPTTTVGHTSFESHQMGPASESQQRKRKAPAPPPTPASITPGPDGTSSPATPSPDSHATETPTPVPRANAVQSTAISATTVVTHTVKPVPLNTAAHPPPLSAAVQNPSSNTTDILTVQDSSSELSHSLEDSDSDLDQAGSRISSLTSSTASGSVLPQPTTKCSSNRMEESVAAKLNEETSSADSSRSESESALNLKLDEVEANRHSAMGTIDQPAPPKPRRSPARESPLLVLSPTLSSPPIEPIESNSLHGSMEPEEAAPQSWLRSVQSSTGSVHKPEAATFEEETLSFGSSSGGSSLPDQGYAASEGMGEDSGVVSSPSETLPTSPDGSFCLDGGMRGGGERLLGPVRDNSSDSDEGCATWGSRHRGNAISPETSQLKDRFEDDPQFRARVHQTLADFEADLADHTDIVSAKDHVSIMPTDSNLVPVSVVDMDVPVTAIDEVLDDYECKIAENKAKSMTRTESAGNKGFFHRPSVELQNKNNNACTADSDKSKTASPKQPSQLEQLRKSERNVHRGDEKVEAKITEATVAAANGAKRNKQSTSSAVKSNVCAQEHNSVTELKPNSVESNSQSVHEKKPVLSINTQRTVQTERHDVKHSIPNNDFSSNMSHGKITHNSTSRFGVKTFTVVPPKPSVLHGATGAHAVTLGRGAIKIDDQGNMMKTGGSQSTFGGHSVLSSDYSELSPLLGKAKDFWISNERQDSGAPHNKGLTKENTDGMKMTPAAISETTFKTSNIEAMKMMQTSTVKLSERAQPQEMVKEEAKESEKDVKLAIEQQVKVGSRVSVSRQQQSYKPTLPPPLLPDLTRDLSFLKSSKRTSSQDVASAINKYTSKTSAVPNSIPNVPLKRHTIGLQRSGRSIQVNPHQTSHMNLTDNKENESAFKSNPPGPQRSMSSPEYVPDSLRDFVDVRLCGGSFGHSNGSIKENSKTQETEKNINKHIQSRGPAQINMGTNYEGENMKHIWSRSPNPAQSSQRSSDKPATAPKTARQEQTSDTRNMTEAANRLTRDGSAQPSVTVLASDVTSRPPSATVFGPVKKFKPVICRSVEKDTSMHSSLMEAIQTGGGRDRLKKINAALSRSMKKASHVEEENERDALLAAIRVQDGSGRLRKTKSEAAVELQEFRMPSVVEKSTGPSSSPSLTCTSPVFPPSPPPPPMIALPPPPPVLLEVKPSTVSRSSANSPMNPALAREAMLEAIRSGSAAEKLKKVAVPTKTVKVNGRLGTIQATSLALPQQ
ncbi:protein cordon-bleu [Brachionichthys hirsutus]|uniref:protein cordon-bleu n=1 Tax=Brachionichthys hirsutus TaxID=412623 RepID=UPI0036053285